MEHAIDLPIPLVAPVTNMTFLKSVIDLQVQGVTDIMYRLSVEKKDEEKYVKEVEELTKYSNSLFKEYAKIYECKEWRLNYKTQKVLE